MEHVEDVKENILPIRQGRKANIMFSALQNPESKSEVNQQRSQFENELRTYAGDDPLSVWLKYIAWVEQNYVTGGRESNLKELTKQCLFCLKDEAVYKNDPRILKVWIKFAHCSPQPLEVFDYMYNNNFCCKLAQFYVHWATSLEGTGNVKAANSTLQYGLKHGAEPLEILQAAIKELDARSVKSVLQSFEPLTLEPETEQRSVFNRLKPQRKEHAAPFLRVGDFVEDKSELPLTLGYAQPQTKKSISNIMPFKVFNGETKTCPQPVDSENQNAEAYIFSSSGNKENNRRPQKWPKVKTNKWMKQFVQPQVPMEHKFTFHCDDDDAQQPAMSPKKLPDGFNVLSARKGDTSPPLALFEPPNPMTQVMYDKVKVYCGGEEYSFEEIRAAKYFKQNREKEQVDQEKHKEEEEREDPKNSKDGSRFQSHAQGVATSQDSDLSAGFSEYKDQGDYASDRMIADTESMLKITHDSDDHVPSQKVVESSADDLGSKNKFDIVQQEFEKNQLFEIYCDSDEKETHQVEFGSELQGPNVPDNRQNIENVPPSGYLDENFAVAGKSLKDIPSFQEDRNPECNLSGDNYTIVPPQNTEQFMRNAIFASTPCTSKSLPSPTSEYSAGNDIPFAQKGGEQAHKNPEVGQGVVCGTETKGIVPLPLEKLSIIFESSHEYQSSRSSSAMGKVALPSNQAYLSYGASCSQATGSLPNPSGLLQRSSQPLQGSNIVSDSKTQEEFAKQDAEESGQSGTAVKIADHDPFDERARLDLLEKMEIQITSHPNFYTDYRYMKNVKSGDVVVAGDTSYIISSYLGKGSYARVFSGDLYSDSFPSLDILPNKRCQVAVKFGSKHNIWEFYICSELHRRLATSTGIDVTDSVMKADSAVRFKDGLIILSELGKHGTLVELVNHYLDHTDGGVPEEIVMYLTFELLHIVSQLHRVNIIHGDIKPDNFLITEIPSFEDVMANMWIKTQCLRLIDFGRGIDLNLYEANTAFRTDIGLFGYGHPKLEECEFIMEYDWSAVAGTIHALLFGKYMKLQQNKDGIFEPVNKLKRYWQTEKLWKPLFSLLLNMHLVTEVPDFTPFLNFIAQKITCYSFKLQLLNLQGFYKK